MKLGDGTGEECWWNETGEMGETRENPKTRDIAQQICSPGDTETRPRDPNRGRRGTYLLVYRDEKHNFTILNHKLPTVILSYWKEIYLSNLIMGDN